MNTKILWKILAIIEIIAATVVVWLDLFNPTLIVLGMIVVSLLIRRESISVLGFQKPKSWLGMIGFALVSVVFLQLFDVGVLMPILNRLTGTIIIYDDFSSLQGNFRQLLFLLALSWTLAALGEEIVYRGYFQKLLGDVFGSSFLGVGLMILLSSLIFGLAHTQQGIVGVLVTTFDAIVFSLLKRKFNNNLWVTIFAHGFYNSIGMIVFYFVGPIYGLW